jgi:glycosyltransferase involved in cell wall biosynthesis
LNSIIRVIIPAFNEENAVGKVIAEIPPIVKEIIVVNNNSNDNTRTIAKQAGATVIDEPVQGYGRACLKGIQYVKERFENTDIIVFLDADYSDYPEELTTLVQPILEEGKDLVIGSRKLGKKSKKSMTPQQVFGNWLATKLIKLFYGVKFTDLGPFRAIKWEKLVALNMADQTYGWTVEMQVKAAKHNFQMIEVPVNYKARIGKSKISGTVKGTILAGYKIISTILKELKR